MQVPNALHVEAHLSVGLRLADVYDESGEPCAPTEAQREVGSVFPRVENPWPDSIGLGFPFTLAGAFGIVADVIYAETSPARRDRVIREGGAHGFRLGALLYLLSLLAQVVFGP